MKNLDMELCKYQHCVDEIITIIKVHNKFKNISGYLNLDHLSEVEEILKRYKIIKEEK